ncbi:MAG TPA: C1 family peptidase [Thermoanaerobaculia bacterium]|nr:C1 family peptidase [Thermoanaerobaculia bacterium]
MKRVYTWKPDLPDHRDHVFAATAGALPPHVDLRPKMTPVFDQGNLGSCTGNAIAGALEYLEHNRVSRLFIYYQERVIEHTVKSDSGAEIRDGVKACHTVGYCGEALWPYRISKFAAKPTAAAYADAAKHKISEYARANSMTSFKTALANGFPIAFGFSVYDSFESNAIAKNGVVPMPAHSEKMLGGHAVLMVGYDDASQRVIVRNSWGPGWGQKGYFTMPYQYVEDRNLSDDFWVIRK